jgi:hypothetical protein
MASCKCGGGQCNCVVTAGPGVTVTGGGSTSNPYIVGADVSTTPGNALTIDSDGLFVPTTSGGGAPVTGCGLTGAGTSADPLRAATGTWPHACDLEDNAGRVYCDADGVLRTDPPPRLTYVEDGGVTTYPDVPVPSGAAATVVQTDTLTIVNPDPCRPAIVIYEAEVDVDYDLPIGARAAMSLDGDEMNGFVNGGASTVTEVHWQGTKLQRRTIPPGGTLTETLDVGLSNGSNGATYNRIGTQMRAWVFNI